MSITFLAFNKTSFEENDKFFCGLQTTLLISGLFLVSFPILGFISPILTEAAPIHFFIQDCLKLCGFSPFQLQTSYTKFCITLLKLMLNTIVYTNWGLISVNTSFYVLWYLRISVDMCASMMSWSVRNIWSKSATLLPLPRRRQVLHNFRADTKFRLFCSLYTRASLGLRIFNDFVNHIISLVLFGGSGLSILCAYGMIKFHNEVHPMLWSMFICGLFFMTYLLSAFLPPACQINHSSSKVLGLWRNWVKAKTARRKIRSFQPLKIFFAPFFYGGRVTSLTVVSVSIDMLVNMLLYKSSFDK